jgi:hypothetical protein
MNPSNYQYGGWYNGQQWNGQTLGPKGVVTVGSNAQPATDPNLTAVNKNNDAYINQLLAQAGGQRDLALKQLDAQHQLALGNNDDNTAKFLESVANQLESSEGQIPYDYNLGVSRENQSYGMAGQGITNSRTQALNQLAEDERSGNANIGLQQGQGNQSTAEDLNSRGLLTGSTPTGLTGGAPTNQALGGINGVGSYGALANNQGFANQRTALQNSIGLQTTAENQNTGLQQQQLDFGHQNALQDLQTTARRGVQDAQNTFNFGTQQANLNYQQQQDQLNRQRLALQLAAPGTAATLTGYQKGILGS